MIQINITCNDGKVYRFGEVNQTNIYDIISSVDVKHDDKLIHSYTFQSNEKPIIKKRSNMKEGIIYIIASYKDNEQVLTFITENGEIIRHGQDCKCDHAF